MGSEQPWSGDLGSVGGALSALLELGFQAAVQRAGLQYAETHSHEPSDEEARSALERVEAAYKAEIAQRQDEIINAFLAQDGERLSRAITAAAQEAASAVHPHS